MATVGIGCILAGGQSLPTWCHGAFDNSYELDPYIFSVKTRKVHLSELCSRSPLTEQDHIHFYLHVNNPISQ